MEVSAVYVVCCRCGERDYGYTTQGKSHTILLWRLWCKDCCQQMKEKAQGAHA